MYRMNNDNIHTLSEFFSLHGLPNSLRNYCILMTNYDMTNISSHTLKLYGNWGFRSLGRLAWAK